VLTIIVLTIIVLTIIVLTIIALIIQMIVNQASVSRHSNCYADTSVERFTVGFPDDSRQDFPGNSHHKSRKNHRDIFYINYYNLIYIG